MKLARQMGMTVKRLCKEMTEAEFQEHWADYRIEPWGELRGDLQAGVIASTIANSNRGEDTPPFKPSDFMLDFDAEPAEPMDEDEALTYMMGAYEAIALASGGEVI